METRVCNKCGGEKSIEDFDKHPQCRGGRRPDCKSCRVALRRQQRMRDPEATRLYNKERMLVAKYGLTIADLENMLESQGGECAVCGTTEPAGRGWHVDHDHSCCPGVKSCGACVRGVLCHRCNTALGLLRDDLKAIENALNYLRAR